LDQPASFLAPGSPRAERAMTITTFLIVANVLVFLLETSAPADAVAPFALWPISSGAGFSFRPWQLVTSAFLHASTTHIVLNMLALYMFGRDVERRLGSNRYLVLYAASVLSAALVQLAVVTAAHGTYPTLGASGGVFGILLAFGWLFPDRVIVLMFPPIPMRARMFVVLYGALELFHGVVGTEQGVAHFAHLGGMLGAWLLLLRWLRPRNAR
jgi:membrane associated rhomboid family serine protease